MQLLHEIKVVFVATIKGVTIGAKIEFLSEKEYNLTLSHYLSAPI
jgi:hypothetical protein